MTNTNTSSQALSSRRPASIISPVLNFLGQTTIRPPSASDGQEGSPSNGFGSSQPVRVKVSRNRPPQYLAEVLQPSTCTRKPVSADRRAPLFTTLPSTAFADPLVSASDSSPTAKCTSEPASAGNDTSNVPKALNLPNQWNMKDKNQSLELSANCQRISYTGLGQLDSHAAAVRSNYPIPPQCGLFYYEVTVVSKGRDGYIGIGLCTQSVQLNRLPGWEDSSWGYHGDDGQTFCGSGPGRAGEGRPYGPVFTTGDVIGCVVNFMNKSISFTKNGVWLGVAFPNAVDTAKLDGGLFPSVGLRTPGEIVEANFGQHRFQFDIEHHYKEEKARIWQEINAGPLPTISTESGQKSGDGSANINQLILSYLVHHGYSETAATFHQDTASSISSVGPAANAKSAERPPFEKEDIRKRQLIRDHVVDGNIDDAITLLNRFYPSVLQQNRHLVFQLKSQRFIELMRAIVGPSSAAADAMDIDGEAGHPSHENAEPESQLRSVVQYGQTLQGEFGAIANPHVQNALVETYSLLAYPEPGNSSVSYLLDPANRLLVADMVNRAILVSQERPPMPAIENVYRQATVVIQELLNGGNGAAAFVKAQECLI
ncbi:ran-binding protein 9-like protein [Powellomyces hirtus]|nr:ran-binding protein 9-like protein [Powellomyces hirtus]